MFHIRDYFAAGCPLEPGPILLNMGPGSRGQPAAKELESEALEVCEHPLKLFLIYNYLF
jgi:hypothetical protein